MINRGSQRNSVILNENGYENIQKMEYDGCALRIFFFSKRKEAVTKYTNKLKADVLERKPCSTFPVLRKMGSRP